MSEAKRKPDVAGTVPAPEYTETADYFAKALELCGADVWITVRGAIPIMLHIGWNTIAKAKEKAVYSAVYKRMQKARRRQALTLPIDMSRSRDGLYAYRPRVYQPHATA